MDNYNDIIDEILEKEGGYVNDRSDKGGETHYGITLKTAREYGYEGDMKNLPIELARTIYSSWYIYKPNFHMITNIDQALAEAVIVFGVHSGSYRASTFLQRLLNVLNNKGKYYSDLKVDGQVGPKTMVALKEYISLRGASGRKIIYDAYKGMVCSFYISLAEKDNSQEKFMYGWLKRIY